jgi:DNA-binding transcriptional LysR family regulator
MQIDPRRLRILRAVALRGGITDAAPLLHLTPSAVSQQLTHLEREVGLPLLDRTGRRIALTEAGRLLAARAERIEAELAAARLELTALSGRATGPVRIAAFMTVIRHLLVPALAQLRRTDPAVEPAVLEIEGAAALRELLTGGVDVLMVEEDGGAPAREPQGAIVEPLLEDHYRLVLPAAWLLRPRALTDLAERPWVSSSADSATGEALHRLGAEHAFSPRRAHVCSEFPAALALVGAGLGAAIVPLLALIDAPPDTVAVISVPGLGFRRLSALRRATPRQPEPVVKAVLAALREQGTLAEQKAAAGPQARAPSGRG